MKRQAQHKTKYNHELNSQMCLPLAKEIRSIQDFTVLFFFALCKANLFFLLALSFLEVIIMPHIKTTVINVHCSNKQSHFCSDKVVMHRERS